MLCPEYGFHKEQRNYTIQEMGEEEIKSFLPTNLGLFSKG
jgi:hypothetical protein